MLSLWKYAIRSAVCIHAVWRAGDCNGRCWQLQSLTLRKRKLLLTTVTLLKAIAKAASTG